MVQTPVDTPLHKRKQARKNRQERKDYVMVLKEKKKTNENYAAQVTAQISMIVNASLRIYKAFNIF